MAKSDKEKINSLASAFLTNRTDENRGELLGALYPWLLELAEFRIRPPHIPSEELANAAVDAALDCVERFEPERGWAFSTFAYQRVVGEMTDYLRKLDPLSRASRAKRTAIDKATIAAGQKQGCTPTHREIAEEMGVSDEEFLQQDLISKEPVLLSARKTPGYYEGRGDFTKWVDHVESPEPPAEQNLASLDFLRATCRGLSQRERLIVIMYGYLDCTMKEIGQTLGLSESRVSQMTSALKPRILDNLRRAGYDYV